MVRCGFCGKRYPNSKKKLWSLAQKRKIIIGGQAKAWRIRKYGLPINIVYCEGCLEKKEDIRETTEDNYFIAS